MCFNLPGLLNFFPCGQALFGGGVKLRDAKRNSLFLTTKLISGEDNLILFQGLWFCCAYSFFLNLVSGWPGAEESRDGVAGRDRKREAVLKN